VTAYNCPLCKQEVSRELYERIMGTWKEKEALLSKLREQQKRLREKELQLADSFRKKAAQLQNRLSEKARKDMERQTAAYKAQLTKQRLGLEKKVAQAQRSYERKLATAVDSALTKERSRQKALLRQMKGDLKRATETAVLKERDRLQSAKDKLQRREARLQHRNEMVVKQLNAHRQRSARQLESATKRIQALEKQVKERETAQALGRLEEDNFLARLKKAFPADRCEKTPGSHCGDILHYVTEGGKEIGLIVYELKTGNTYSKSHVQQCLRAKQDREADYGLLVTEARPSKDPAGIAVSKGVIVVHHAAAVVVVEILRRQLVTVARLKVGAEERREMVREVMAYLQSPNFKNAIEGIVQESVDLYEELKKEVVTHVKGWESRLSKYRNIMASAHGIETGVRKIGMHGERKPVEGEAQEIERIALPESIG
jgi:hypothetical protein